MQGQMPTMPGDLLLIVSEVAHSYCLGVVSRPEQQDFLGAPDEHVIWMESLDKAMGRAVALTRHGGRIFVKDMDSAEWWMLS